VAPVAGQGPSDGAAACDAVAIKAADDLITNSRTYLAASQLDDALYAAYSAHQQCESYIPAGIQLAYLLRTLGDVGAAVEILQTVVDGFPKEARDDVERQITTIQDSYSRFTLEIRGPSGTLEAYDITVEFEAPGLQEQEQRQLQSVVESLTRSPQLAEDVVPYYLPPGRISIRVWSQDPRFPCSDQAETRGPHGFLIGERTWNAAAGGVRSIRLDYECGSDPWWLAALVITFGGFMFR
jgi:hypothetical protein